MRPRLQKSILETSALAQREMREVGRAIAIGEGGSAWWSPQDGAMAFNMPEACASAPTRDVQTPGRNVVYPPLPAIWTRAQTVIKEIKLKGK
jgi:hypothetical protein